MQKHHAQDHQRRHAHNHRQGEEVLAPHNARPSGGGGGGVFVPPGLLVIGAALFLNAVTLPLMLKFGAEKSRTISMGLFVVIFGGSALAAMMLKPTPIASRSRA